MACLDPEGHVKKIEKLTAKQTAALAGYRDEWTAIGLSTEPANRAEAEAGIDEAYAAAGLPAPGEKLWALSPLAGALLAAQTVHGRQNVSSAEVRAELNTVFWSQHEAGWLSFYDYFAFIGLECCSRLSGLIKIAQNAGWCWLYDRAAILTERPVSLHRNVAGRLHNTEGLALEYRDGWGVAAINGTRIPSKWMEDKNSLDPTTALTWPNIEQRRAAAELIGWKKVLAQLKPKTIDRDADPEIGTLLQVDLPDAPNSRFLQVLCGTGRQFVLPVPSTVQTAKEANAWTYNLSPADLDLEART